MPFTKTYIISFHSVRAWNKRHLLLIFMRKKYLKMEEAERQIPNISLV